MKHIFHLIAYLFITLPLLAISTDDLFKVDNRTPFVIDILHDNPEFGVETISFIPGKPTDQWYQRGVAEKFHKGTIEHSLIPDGYTNYVYIACRLEGASRWDVYLIDLSSQYLYIKHGGVTQKC